jgi:hypothetical protein
MRLNWEENWLLSVKGFLAIAAVVVAVLIAVVVPEVEQIEEIADGRTIQRHIGIVIVRDGVREVIAAAMSERLQVPIPFDELEDRHVVGIPMADVAAARKWRHRN